MKIVCGLDMHKGSICFCILSSTGEIFEGKIGVLTNHLEEMRNLMLTCHFAGSWVGKYKCLLDSAFATVGTPF